VEQAASAVVESSTDDVAGERKTSTGRRRGRRRRRRRRKSATAGGAVVQEREFERVQIGDLEDRVGDDVRLEGEVTNVRQTSGPTVFEVRDETGTVDCAAFVEAGVRAYPEVEEDDVVRLDGEVRDRRGELQVETESLEALEADERENVEERMADALDARARPDAVDPLADDPAIEGLSDSLVEAATAIRKAVITDRPVIVRHSATADGYVAGVAIERATLPLVREEHRRADAEYHYFDRRPWRAASTTWTTPPRTPRRCWRTASATTRRYRCSSSSRRRRRLRESLDGFELLDVYGAPRVVLDDADADDEVVESVDTILSPALSDAPETTATALAANVAAHVNEDVRSDLMHLPR